MTATPFASPRTWRVAQWAAGRIGRAALRAVIAHPRLELVALRVHSPDKVGRDAGELAGIVPVGVAATASLEEVLAARPDCVLYTPEGYDVETLAHLLEAGVNVVTTRGEFHHPPLMAPQLRERLEEAAQRGRASLFATGSSPGFITQVLPAALLCLERRFEALTIDEFADIPASTSPQMITEVMGFGGPVPETFDRRILDHVAVGFAQSLASLASAVGLAVEGVESEGEFARATQPIPLPGGAVIEPGTLAGQRITVTLRSNGGAILRFRANWYCGRHLDRNWELADNGWRVQVAGDAPLDLRIGFPHPGDPQRWADQMSNLTAHPAVNAVPWVCEAPPGILGTADLPSLLPWFGA